MNWLRTTVLVLYTVIACAPLVWLGLTSLKPPADATSLTLKAIPLPGAEPDSVHTFAPTFAAYASLGTPPVSGVQSGFWQHCLTSVIIGLVSTAAAVALGTCTAYGFSRFRIAGAKDWLFFILSTRFLPPLAVVTPILIMYRHVDMQNSHIGLMLLYTVFNLSLAVWLMKGFIDDIPKAFEEAALIDGYSRVHAFFHIIIPQARTGMAVTAVFCLIAAWNEYGFALSLNPYEAKTVPVYFAGLQGNINGIPWPQVAAGALVFVAPIMVFTVLVRRHLLRGVTFGTIKQ